MAGEAPPADAGTNVPDPITDPSTPSQATVQEPPKPASLPVLRAPDSLMLTQRELEERIGVAVAKAAAEAFKKVPMSEPAKPEPSTVPATPAIDPIAKLREEMETKMANLKAATEDATSRAAEAEAKAQAAEQALAEEKQARKRAKDKATEANIRAEAARAGIEDDDYAVVLYARAARSALTAKDAEGNAAPQPVPQPAEFFASLRKSKPALFKAPEGNAAPLASTAAPAPAEAGGNVNSTVPVPVGSAAKSEQETVDEMDQMDFNRRTRDKYNYNPSLAS